jgi:hypothetical protein
MRSHHLFGHQLGLIIPSESPRTAAPELGRPAPALGHDRLRICVALGEGDDRNDPHRLTLVAGESGVQGGLTRKEEVSLGALNLYGMNLERLITDLDPGVWVGLEVVVPIGVRVGACLGREHQIAVTVSQVHHRVDARFASSRSGGVQQDEWRTFEPPADSIVIVAELLIVRALKAPTSLI